MPNAQPNTHVADALTQLVTNVHATHPDADVVVMIRIDDMADGELVDHYHMRVLAAGNMIARAVINLLEQYPDVAGIVMTHMLTGGDTLVVTEPDVQLVMGNA